MQEAAIQEVVISVALKANNYNIFLFMYKNDKCIIK